MSGRHLPPDPPDGSDLLDDDPPGMGSRVMWALGGLLAIGVIIVAVTVLDGGTGDEDTTTTSTTAAAGETTITALVTSTAPPDSNATTPPDATTSIPSTTTETTLANPLAALVLGEQNIGSINFGNDADAVIAEFTTVLGSPDEDTGWVDSFSTFGTCPGTEARLVRWTSLQGFFTNGATDWAAEGTRHFFHYSQSAAAGGGEILTLMTDKSIGLGASVAELRAAYGSQLTVTDDPLFDTLWEVSPSGPGLLWGSASDSTDSGLVTAINGGFGCGE